MKEESEYKPIESKKYNLTKTNTAFLAVSMLCHALFFFATSNRTSQFTQYVCISFVTITLMPYFFGWMAWVISGIKAKGGSFSYNVVFTLLAICSITIFQKQMNLKRFTDIIISAKPYYFNVFQNAESTKASNQALRDYANAVSDGFKGMQENSVGYEKEFYEILNEVSSKKISLGMKWMQAFERLHKPNMLQYSLLKNPGEMEIQQEAVLEYQNLTKEFSKETAGFTASLESELGDLLDKSSFARDFFEGIVEREKTLKKSFQATMTAHARYGKCLMALLQHLETHHDNWSFVNDEVIFADHLHELFDTSIRRLQKAEANLDQRIEQHNIAMVRD